MYSNESTKMLYLLHLQNAAEERAAKARRIEDVLQVRVRPCHVRKWLDFFHVVWRSCR